jgi:hypothetical protein
MLKLPRRLEHVARNQLHDLIERSARRHALARLAQPLVIITLRIRQRPVLVFELDPQ